MFGGFPKNSPRDSERSACQRMFGARAGWTIYCRHEVVFRKGGRVTPTVNYSYFLTIFHAAVGFYFFGRLRWTTGILLRPSTAVMQGQRSLARFFAFCISTSLAPRRPRPRPSCLNYVGMDSRPQASRVSKFARAHSGPVNSMCFTPNGLHLLTAGTDNRYSTVQYSGVWWVPLYRGQLINELHG